MLDVPILARNEYEMTAYLLTWITDQLAVGHAPMSYAELDSIREQGIDAIVNLCGEFSDLHEIEQQAGFEVFFLPVADETAPEMVAMENGLAWLDEAMYLGKKVLVHCRHGIGRTGTFVTAYLLRRGFTLKQAGRLLKGADSRANPTNFSQWWLLRRFGRKERGVVSVAPSPVNRERQELGEFFLRYEELQRQFQPGLMDEPTGGWRECRKGACHGLLLTLIEALYLQEKVNRGLPVSKRQALIEQVNKEGRWRHDAVRGGVKRERIECLLRHDGVYLAADFSVIRSCLLKAGLETGLASRFNTMLDNLSQSVFLAVFDWPTVRPLPRVRMTEVISGRFIQVYFQFIQHIKNGG